MTRWGRDAPDPGRLGRQGHETPKGDVITRGGGALLAGTRGRDPVGLEAGRLRGRALARPLSASLLRQGEPAAARKRQAHHTVSDKNSSAERYDDSPS